ncbi:hypothetical protein SAMN05446934_1243 [Paraburkholderia hospita]|nr:hypothetical protein SAMN05446934_1243 [Paraburkholderia hospita]
MRRGRRGLVDEDWYLLDFRPGRFIRPRLAENRHGRSLASKDYPHGEHSTLMALVGREEVYVGPLLKAYTRAPTKPMVV